MGCFLHDQQVGPRSCCAAVPHESNKLAYVCVYTTIRKRPLPEAGGGPRQFGVESTHTNTDTGTHLAPLPPPRRMSAWMEKCSGMPLEAYRQHLCVSTWVLAEHRHPPLPPLPSLPQQKKPPPDFPNSLPRSYSILVWIAQKEPQRSRGGAQTRRTFQALKSHGLRPEDSSPQTWTRGVLQMFLQIILQICHGTRLDVA